MGLEAREPYLDYRLVEFAASLPPNLKLKNFWHKKYLLKKSMEGHLPQDIIWRKKAGSMYLMHAGSKATLNHLFWILSIIP